MVVTTKPQDTVAPNTDAGRCGRSGLMARARKAAGLTREPTLIADDNERRRRQPKMCEQEEEDKQQTSHHQVVNVRLEQILIAGKPSLHESGCPDSYQTPRQDQSNRQTQTTDERPMRLARPALLNLRAVGVSVTLVAWQRHPFFRQMKGRVAQSHAPQQVISTAVLSELYITLVSFSASCAFKGADVGPPETYGRLWSMELRAPAQIRNVSPGATLRSRRRERRTTYRNRATTPGHLDSESPGDERNRRHRVRRARRQPTTDSS